MKKVLLVLAICFLPFMACEKQEDPTFCWTCKIDAWASNSSNHQYSTTEVCDKTEDEIKEIEKQGTFTQHYSGFNTYTKTTCKKKP